jgi:hypothetical protein
MSPVAWATPVLIAAPFPRFTSWKTSRISPADMVWSSCRVPSVDASSTTMISFARSTGAFRTCSITATMVRASLYTGITTESVTGNLMSPRLRL